MKIPNIPMISAPKALKPNASRVEQKGQSPSGRVAPDRQDRQKARLKQSCQDFEAIFLNNLLSKMREATAKSDLFGSSRGEELYRGLLDEELAKQMAAGGGVGLARTLYAQMADQAVSGTGQTSSGTSGPDTSTPKR